MTIAKANRRGRMQCAWCGETFGPASAFARRLEAADIWHDHVVAAQHAKVMSHVWKKHSDELARKD